TGAPAMVIFRVIHIHKKRSRCLRYTPGAVQSAAGGKTFYQRTIGIKDGNIAVAIAFLVVAIGPHFGIGYIQPASDSLNVERGITAGHTAVFKRHGNRREIAVPHIYFTSLE